MRLLLVTLLLVGSAQAQVHLPNVFSDHAVLQRDRPIRIWGTAAPGESVAIQIHGASAKTTAGPDGRWLATLPAQPAGGPFELTVNTITLKDILFGDVVLATGQSNMGYSFAGIDHQVTPGADKLLAAAGDPNLRLLRIPKEAAVTPQADQATRWAVSTPQSAQLFSLLGYLVGRDLSDLKHVPVGVIQAAYGGTPAEAWVSKPTIDADPALHPANDFFAYLTAQQADVPGAPRGPNQVAGGAPGTHLKYPHLENWAPGNLFNSMINPVAGYQIRGAIWLQGESSTEPERSVVYNKMLDALIGDWRNHWHEEFPFIIVQIAGFTGGPRLPWGIVRDAQRRSLEVPGTALVVTYDKGIAANPHWPDKVPVADRIVLAARDLFYGEHLEDSGPLFASAKPQGPAMLVAFTHAEGIHPAGSTLLGFEVAGADKQYKPATAEIKGDAILAQSSQVPDPQYVRYAWANLTNANLANAANLPASAFTSDDAPPVVPPHSGQVTSFE